MSEELKKLISKRVQFHLWREKKKLSPEEKEYLINGIIKEIGFPSECYFEDEYCNSFSDKDEKVLELQLGHIKPHSKGGSITNPKNIIWICSRHNWIMGTNDLEELEKKLKSVINNHGIKF